MAFFSRSKVSKSKLDARLASVSMQGFDPGLVAKLRTFLLGASETELSRVDVVTLADRWEVPRSNVIPLFLHAAKAGVVVMNYVLHCQSCQSTWKKSSMQRLSHQMACPMCKAGSTPTLDRSVEMAFAIHPEIAGVVPDVSPGKVAFLPAIEVINTDDFRQLFEMEKPVPGEYLGVENLTLLFSDLSGSTAVYDRLGDGTAYGLVREHFLIMFDAIRKHNGSVVKTIGDSVMAAFVSPADAVACALETKNAFQRFNSRKDIRGQLRLKIGIHAGACLAVTLNQRLDFFGSTVNKAARIQDLADKDEVCLSEDVARQADGVLLKRKTTRKRVTLRGIKEPVNVLVLRK